MIPAPEPLTFSDQGPLLVHAHANGYPPLVYRSFLEHFLDSYQVKGIYLRPFWTGTNPEALSDWRVFRDDYLAELPTLLDKIPESSRTLIGMGHSLGAVTTLMAAIKIPETFRALVLIEPTIFPAWQGNAMRLLAPLRLFRHLHPLIRRTLRRKTSFPDRETMFQNYRSKGIFRKIPDPVLRDYVAGLAAEKPDGTLTITYPPLWEARIYETGGSVDRYVLENAGRVTCPTLILRGEESDTLGARITARLVERLPLGEGITLPAAGHLLPLEAPERAARLVLDFLGRVLN
jgi:pimeloyl-ACP methyl ester carboxylesterase